MLKLMGAHRLSNLGPLRWITLIINPQQLFHSCWKAELLNFVYTIMDLLAKGLRGGVFHRKGGCI
jgi:hypothetical protein